MSNKSLDYEKLPNQVQHNLTPEQWREARHAVIEEGRPVPETTQYINLKNGVSHTYEQGHVAEAPLLANHDLAGGRGQDSTQFHSKPPEAHMP